MNKPLRTQWDFSSFITDFSEETIKQEQVDVAARYRAFINRWKDDESYLKDPKALAEALEEIEELHATGGTGGDMGYALELSAVLDQADTARKATLGKFTEFERKLGTEAQFFGIRLSKVSSAQQHKFLAAPELARFKKDLEQTFELGAHTLSEAEERIETLKAGVSRKNWVDMTEDLLGSETRMLAGEEKTLPQLLGAFQSADKKLRDEAAAGVNSIVAQYRKVAEYEMNSVLENKKIEDEIRGWEHPESARLFSDDVSKKMVDTMTLVVSDSYEISRDYYELKAAILGLPKLAYHERVFPVGATERTFSYEEGYELVEAVLRRLDPQFADIMNEFSDRGLIDVYPRKGKRGGAACWHGAISQPTYVLLNWTDKLGDVTTFAHELGHGINNELIKQKQTATYFGTPTSTAEVASTFMEDFVLRELEGRANEEERFALMVEKLDDVVSSIFRQVACYRFEKDLHETYRKEGYLSADKIGELFLKHMGEYMGPAITQDPGSENWWVYWSHIRSHFYVYSYASGLLISTALQAKVRENPAFIAEVKEFLSTGMAESPHDIFMKTGIDIEDTAFWEDGVAEIKKMLEETRALALKLGKI